MFLLNGLLRSTKRKEVRTNHKAFTKKPRVPPLGFFIESLFHTEFFLETSWQVFKNFGIDF